MYNQEYPEILPVNNLSQSFFNYISIERFSKGFTDGNMPILNINLPGAKGNDFIDSNNVGPVNPKKSIRQ